MSKTEKVSIGDARPADLIKAQRQQEEEIRKEKAGISNGKDGRGINAIKAEQLEGGDIKFTFTMSDGTDLEVIAEKAKATDVDTDTDETKEKSAKK